MNARRWASLIWEPLLDLWGPTSLGSGWRSPGLNRAVGGSLNPPSAHLSGRAGDTLPTALGIVDAFDRLLTSKLCFDKAILETKAHAAGPPTFWVHVQIARGEAARRLAFMSFGSNLYPRWNRLDPRVKALEALRVA